MNTKIIANPGVKLLFNIDELYNLANTQRSKMLKHLDTFISNPHITTFWLTNEPTATKVFKTYIDNCVDYEKKKFSDRPQLQPKSAFCYFDNTVAKLDFVKRIINESSLDEGSKNRIVLVDYISNLLDFEPELYQLLQEPCNNVITFDVKKACRSDDQALILGMLLTQKK